MGLLRSIEELDLTPPDHYEDLQIWLKRNFKLLQQHIIVGEICLSAYDAQPARASATNLHGGLVQIVSGGALNSGAPQAISNGLGKIFLMPTAGTDLVGDILVTGTKIDRSTGVATPGFVETVSINWATAAVDSSFTDANGNTVWQLTNGVLTTNWFLGAVTLSTVAPADVNISALDVYGIAFEQLNDTPLNVLNTFDINLLCSNTLGRFDAYLYSVIVNSITGRATVINEADLALGVPPTASRYYRLRDSSLDVNLNGATDGVFAQLHYPSSPARIEDVTCKIWLNNPTG